MLIQSSNWKFESLQNPRSLTFGEMYTMVGFHHRSIGYFQGYLSQFAHGLCLSNKPDTASEQMERILHECIPIADRFVQAICQTFSDKEIINHFLCSDIIQKFHASKIFNFDDLADFAIALVRKDKTLLI